MTTALNILIGIVVIPCFAYLCGYLLFRKTWEGKPRAIVRFSAFSLLLVGVVAWTDAGWWSLPLGVGIQLAALFAFLTIEYRKGLL